MFLRKELMDKKQRKWNFEREDKKENQKRKQNRKKRRIFKRPFGETKMEKEPLKLQENNLFGPFYKTQAQKHTQSKKKQNHQKTKRQTTTTAFCIGANNPLLLVNVCFFKLHSFISAKLCFAENTNKEGEWEEHSF